MVQAAATGAIDFREADHFDRSWEIKRNLLLSYVARTNLQEIYKSKLQQQLAVLSYATEQSTFDHHWEQANKLQGQLIEATLPWLDVTPKDTKEIAEQVTQEYIEAFDDPNSPEFQAEADRLIEYWRSTRRNRDVQ
jgi:hypothetical protein